MNLSKECEGIKVSKQNCKITNIRSKTGKHNENLKLNERIKQEIQTKLKERIRLLFEKSGEVIQLQ